MGGEFGSTKKHGKRAIESKAIADYTGALIRLCPASPHEPHSTLSRAPSGPSRAAEVLAPALRCPVERRSARARRRQAVEFLHISKPEIDLDPDIDAHDPAVYAKAAENLGDMIASGILTRDPLPGYYVYRLTRAGRTQTGLAAVASLADYAANRIRKHELTTPPKEDDRVRQIEAVNAQTGPVMIGYPAAPEIDAHAGARAAAARPRST